MVSIRAITLFLLIMVERVFIIVLRGNICLFLKRKMNFLEMRCISTFHLFEFIVYISAWIGGKICLRHWKIVIFIQTLLLAIGIGLLSWGNDHLDESDNLAHRALFTSAFALVGVSHGLQLATTLKLMDTDVIRSKKNMSAYFVLFLATDVCGFVGMTVFDDYMIIVYIGALLLLCQLLVIALFISDQTEFETYPHPFNEWRVYIDAYFQHVIIYANENIETRKTFKETRKERKMRMIKELLVKRKKLLAAKQGPRAHFLDMAIPKYGIEYINDVKLKWRLRSLFFFLPMVWIGIELQYSYWLLSVYRMDRLSFLNPPQLILAVNGVTTFLFIPIFSLLINSILKYAKFHTGMHRMVIGGLFVVMAVFLALNNINTQETNREKANEPYFNQVKQVVINGINCNLSFNEKVHVEYQQSFGMKTGGPVYRLMAKKKEDSRRRRSKRAEKPVMNYDEYYESYDLDAFVFEWNWSTFFDMVIYYIDPTAKGQMLTVFPYDCKDRAPFDFQLDVKDSSDIQGLSEYDIVFIAPPDLSSPRVLRVGHQREDESRPGLRFLIGNDTIVKKFLIYRGDKEVVYSFPGLTGLTTDFYWFEPNDGPNLNFIIDEAMFKGRFVFRKGGLYNVVFTANKDTPINSMSIYYAEPPFSINYLWVLPQFIVMTIGELLFGMMGCQFFVDETPQKLKYHTMLDWYWALAMSNLAILIVIHCGFVITFFFQVYWLSVIVLIGFFFFFYFTFRFPFIHLRLGEEPKYVEPVKEEPVVALEDLPVVEVTVAADPTALPPVPPEPQADLPVEDELPFTAAE